MQRATISPPQFGALKTPGCRGTGFMPGSSAGVDKLPQVRLDPAHAWLQKDSVDPDAR